MEIKPPPNFVANYRVHALEYVIDKNTQLIRPAYDNRHPVQPVNTFDIQAFCQNPKMYIMDWQEVHFHPMYDSSGALRWGEEAKEYGHLENQHRLLELNRLYGDMLLHPTVPHAKPTIVPLEYELLEMGWVFTYAAGYGPVIPLEMDVEVNWHTPAERERVAQLKAQYEAKPLIVVPDIAPVPQPSLAQMQATTGGQLPASNPVELKLDSLIEQITLLTGAVGQLIHANSHPVANIQLSAAQPAPDQDERHR